MKIVRTILERFLPPPEGPGNAMKLPLRLVAVSLASLACASTSTTPRQAATPPLETTMTQDSSTRPDDPRRWLDRLAGRWKLVSTFTLNGVKTPFAEAEAELRWIMNGTWLERAVKADVGGNPFESRALYGYDDYKKRFVFVDAQSVRACLLQAEGDLNESKTSLILFGRMDDPTRDRRDGLVKYAIRVSSDDAFVEEIHDITNAESQTFVIETSYVRVK